MLETGYGSCIYEHPWTLITDEKADPGAVEQLRSLGKQVFLVGMDDIMT